MPTLDEDSPVVPFASSAVETNKWSLVGILVGLFCLGIGVFLYKGGFTGETNKIEIINADEVEAEDKQIVVEIAGAVVNPGVYKIKNGSRIEDLMIVSGGLDSVADRSWFEKSINRAAKLNDGQKLYIYKTGELSNQSDASSARNLGGVKIDQGVATGAMGGLVNINTSGMSDLDKLPGIGQVYGQSIIDHRPYSTIEELVSKGAIKAAAFDKIKDLVTAN